MFVRRTTCRRARRLFVGHQVANAHKREGRPRARRHRPDGATAPLLASRAPGLPRLEPFLRAISVTACVSSAPDASLCLPTPYARASLSHSEAAAQQAALNRAPTLEERRIPGPWRSAMPSLLICSVAWLQPHSSRTAMARLFRSTYGADALFAGGYGTPTCSAAQSKSQLLFGSSLYLRHPLLSTRAPGSHGSSCRLQLTDLLWVWPRPASCCHTRRCCSPCLLPVRRTSLYARSQEPRHGPAPRNCVENLLLTWRPGADSASKERTAAAQNENAPPLLPASPASRTYARFSRVARCELASPLVLLQS